MKWWCRLVWHRWEAWRPVNPDRVAREPARAFLEGRQCHRCGAWDQLRMHDADALRAALAPGTDQPST